MAINGLEKITDKILAEAQARADRILADAQAECDRISADYAARAEEIRTRLSEEAERVGMDHVSRTKSAVATNKRNLLLQTRSELIDGVFDEALTGVLRLSTEQYTELLIGLLSAAMMEQLEAEHTSRTLYGEEDAMEPEKYEVLLNQRDRDRCGRAVVEGVQKKLGGKVSAEKLAKLTLGGKAVAIDGGLILRCGDIEANCSLSLLFAQLREELEADVSHALFDVKTSN
ncbi:MAG: V-type ATP synthase subunit E [Clostridia bacterium]|nr:V-type ATP synthase subunit E [Clostridia bacterium]